MRHLVAETRIEPGSSAPYAGAMAQRPSRTEFRQWTAHRLRQHDCRIGQRIETRIIRFGTVELGPPSISLRLNKINGD
jgi:hypothetical protein